MENLFDPDVSVILEELESGPKESLFIAKKLEISEDEIKNRLSYLLDHDFVMEKNKTYSADADKLNKVLESDKSFDGVVDGLTKMDSYLN